MDQKSILLIENDLELKRVIEGGLEEEGFKVFSIEKVTKIEEAIGKQRPDLILLDWDLHKIDGETACLRISEQYSSIPMIIISSQEGVSALRAAFSCGADDFVTKPINIERLLVRIKGRLNIIGRHEKGQTLKIEDLEMNDDKKTVERDGSKIRLSKTEYDLLKYMLRNKRQVLSREQILSRVWGTEKYIEPRVVDVYIGYLRKKIDTGHEKKLIKTRRGFGYMIG